MHVKVHTRLEQKITPALASYVDAKLVHPLNLLCQKRDAHVSIELSDDSHERKGPYRQCRVVVMLPQQQPIVISEADENMYEAIDKAENRVLVHVKRELGRRGGQHRLRIAKRRERARVARRAFTCPREPWEREVAEYEAAAAGR